MLDTQEFVKGPDIENQQRLFKHFDRIREESVCIRDCLRFPSFVEIIHKRDIRYELKQHVDSYVRAVDVLHAQFKRPLFLINCAVSDEQE